VDNIEPGEIVYCDITYQYERPYRNRTKTETVELINIVFGREYVDTYPLLEYKTYKRDILKINRKKPLECDVRVIDLKVHARTGFKRKNIGYTHVKKSEQIRNNITGAYE
tara:strand:- start:80 stop:409 length:330 start_codon:yes stop_codon:yes gene_type:complete